MKILQSLFLGALLVAGQSQAARPTDGSIKELFAVAHTEEMMSSIQTQVNSLTNNIIQDALKGEQISPEKQKALDKFKEKLEDIRNQELSWAGMEPMMISIYADSLSQEDVDGIINFYKSPAGQAFIQKMPVMIQQSMLQMQAKIKPLMEKIKQAQQELKTDLDNADKKMPAKAKK